MCYAMLIPCYNLYSKSMDVCVYNIYIYNYNVRNSPPLPINGSKDETSLVPSIILSMVVSRKR